MTSTTTERTALESPRTAARPLPELVDWLLAALVAMAGLALLAGGSVLVFLVDRALIADAIADEALVSETLTDAELLEVAAATVTWTGIGHLVVGVALVLAAVGYVVVRHRAHRRAATGASVQSSGTNALLGAVVTLLTSFLAFSPLLGGVVAGYLQRGRGASRRTVTVGAASGVVATAPFAVILLFVFGGLLAGGLAVQQFGAAIAVVAVGLLATAVVVALAAALGAGGGYLGGRLAERFASA